MAAAAPPTLLSVQASGIVDHTTTVGYEQLRELAGEAGGSRRVSAEELERLLAQAPPSTTTAGGSAANTLRGLAKGFAVPCGVVGAVGGDDWGRTFASALETSGVDTSRLTVDADKTTGRCAVLITPDGQRTMRTALAGSATLQAEQLRTAAGSFAGVAWVSLTAFAYYVPGLVDAVVDVARGAGARLILHLASYEVVRSFGPQLRELLASRAVAVVMGNEDEAREFMLGCDLPADAEHAVRHLASMCDTAVVTLGRNGSLAVRGELVVNEPAVDGVTCVDSTGAGDLFAAGFMFGLFNELTLASCVRLGCLAGAAVVKGHGAEVTPEAWEWARSMLPHVEMRREPNMPAPVTDAADAPASQTDSTYW